MAHLIDEELQLENSGAALVLAVGVHPRPSQSDGVPKVKEAQRRHIVDRVRLSSPQFLMCQNSCDFSKCFLKFIFDSPISLSIIRYNSPSQMQLKLKLDNEREGGGGYSKYSLKDPT